MSDTKTTPATRYATPRLTDGGEIRERPRFAALRSLYRRKLALIAAIVVLTVTLVAILAPVLTSTGKGSDIMGPMAVPIVGGMTIELLTMFVVPVLYSAVEEVRRRRRRPN